MLHYSTLGMQIKVSSLSAWLRFRANLKSFSAIKVLSLFQSGGMCMTAQNVIPMNAAGKEHKKKQIRPRGKREEQTAQNRGMRERE